MKAIQIQDKAAIDGKSLNINFHFFFEWGNNKPLFQFHHITKSGYASKKQFMYTFQKLERYKNTNMFFISDADFEKISSLNQVPSKVYLPKDYSDGAQQAYRNLELAKRMHDPYDRG